METRVELFLLKKAKAFIRTSGLASYIPSEIYSKWKTYPMALCYALRDAESGIVCSFAILHRMGRDIFQRATRAYVMDFIFTHPTFQRRHHATRLLEHMKTKEGTIYVFVEPSENPNACTMLKKVMFNEGRTPDGGQAYIYDNE